MHARIACTAWLATAALALGQTAPAEITNAPMSSSFAQTNGGCNNDSGNGGCGNGRSGRLYGDIEYLLFNFRDGPAPALIQHVPNNLVFTAPLPAGAAITMYGDGIRQHAFNGFRAELGYWLNDDWAAEVSWFQFETKNKRFSIASQGDPSIGRFYQDVSSSANTNTYLIFAEPADPNVVGSTRQAGFIDAEAPTRLWGTEFNIKKPGYAVFSDTCDYLVGFRYIDLREGIFISDGATFLDGSGLSIFGTDRFYTTNQFYGAQVGFSSHGDLGCGFTFDVGGKIAIGGVEQQVAIDGVTIRSVNGVVQQTTVGHVLTQQSNVGHYSRSRFAFVPELLLKVGYQLGEHWNFSIGYDLLTITSVIRPGATIDEGVNPNLSPILIPNGNTNVQRPGFAFHGTDFWAQGITFGFAFRY